MACFLHLFSVHAACFWHLFSAHAAYFSRLFSAHAAYFCYIFTIVFCITCWHFSVFLTYFCKIFSFRIRSIVLPPSPKERNCYVSISHQLAATQLVSLYSHLLCTRQTFTNDINKCAGYQYICCSTAQRTSYDAPREHPHAIHHATLHAPHAHPNATHRATLHATHCSGVHEAVHAAIHRPSYGIFLHVYVFKQRICIRTMPNAT